MDLIYGLCVAASLMPMQCDREMSFREVYNRSCYPGIGQYTRVDGHWTGRRGEQLSDVFQRLADGTALYQDYLRVWHDVCDKKGAK